MLKSGEIPDCVFLDVVNKQGETGSRVKPQNPNYDTSPTEANIKPTSIRAVFTHVGDWIYGDITYTKEDYVKCPRYYQKNLRGIGYSVDGYFPYDVVKVRICSKVGKVHNCPTCRCNQNSDETIEEIEIPQLEKPKDTTLTSVISGKYFNITITHYDEAFSLFLLYKYY